MGKGGHGGGSCCHGGGGLTTNGLTAGHELATAQHKKREDNRLEQRRVRAKLVAATVFAVVFMSVEVAGGILAGSLAIVTDAAHLFTDVANFITAILASHLSETPASSKHSYGLVRAEVLSALINTGVIVILAAYLIYEAIRRIVTWFQGTAEPIDGFLMMIVAIIGVVFNIVLMLIFGHEHGHAHGGHDHGHSHGHSHGGHSHSHNDEEAGHGHGHGHHHHGHEEEEEEEEEEDHHHHRGRHHSTSSHASHGSHHSHGGGRSSRHASQDSTHSHDSHSHGRKSRSSTSTSEKGGLLVPNEDIVTVTTTYGSLPATQQHHDHDHDHDHDEEQLSGSATKLTGPKKKKKKKEKKHRNINLEAAHLHVITDLVQSIGVALAGVLIYFKPHWQVVDPICTILFSIAICYSVVSMLAKSTHVLLEGVPEGVDPDDLHDKLRAIDGVTDVHDLHIWMLSIGRPLVTVHIKAADPDVAMKEAQAIFTKAGIDHITIQMQRDECLPNECAHPCVSVACVSTSSQDGNSPGRAGGCTYL